MATMLSDFPETVSPSPEDALLAQESSRRLTKLMAVGKPQKALNLRIQPENAPEETV